MCVQPGRVWTGQLGMWTLSVLQVPWPQKGEIVEPASWGAYREGSV